MLRGARARRSLAVVARWARPAKPTTRQLAAILADPHSYERQIERLLDRHAMGRGMHELRQGDVSFASVAARGPEAARLIARTVAAGQYTPAPAEIRTIRAGGKRRVVVALGLVDLLVHGVVADALEQAIEPTLSPSLFSYRTGVPWWRGAQEFAAWIRRRPNARASGRERGGLYIIRRDVSAYTDAIPVTGGSPLWPMLERAFETDAPDGAAMDVVRAVVRPAVMSRGGFAAPRNRGVPTGQPISCVLFNLYLGDVDHALSAVRGAFYARYSDDIVFAHADPEVVRDASVLLDNRVAGLGLSLNAAKSRDYYLTRAGHRSRAWPAARGTQFVPLLGLRVGADGTVGLEPAKARELVRDLRRRAWAAAAADPDEAGRLVCAVVRRALDADDMQAAAKAAPLLRHVVTDRRQLAELDHRIAREVAGVLVGDRTIRAFRSLPPAALRAQYGLPSLVEQRNGRRPAAFPLSRHRGTRAPMARGARSDPVLRQTPSTGLRVHPE